MNGPVRIPSADECRSLMVRYKMLPNIEAHSKQVTKVSMAIVDRLNDSTLVNRDLVYAAAMLHDITKTRSLETGEHHDQSGADLLEELGYPEVAGIVRRHVFYSDFNPTGTLREADIVYYADKRVMHDLIVTLDERVDDLINRYGTTPERMSLIRENSKLMKTMEKKIRGFVREDISTVINRLAHE